MILLIDTTKKHELGSQLADYLKSKGRTDIELVTTEDKKISPCLGCNHCWLKTPGICSIHDDYEPILKLMKDAKQVWLLSDTSFGFVNYKAKNVVDRVMPLVTMYLHFVKGQMRHVMRYDSQPDWGMIYTGDGDQAYLERWCERVALNFGSSSRGVFKENDWKEAAACM